MFMPESVAKTKFCPMMRAVMTAPGGNGPPKFAGGNNLDLQGRGLTCAGTGCMMWQQVGTHKVQTKEKCPKCKAKEPECKDCKDCEGQGYVIIIESIGSCGLNHLHEALHLERMGERINVLAHLALAEKGIKVGKDGAPILPELQPAEPPKE